MKKRLMLIIVIAIIITTLGESKKAQAKSLDTEQAIINEIRKNMLEREKEFTITTNSELGYKIRSNSDDLLNQAIAIDKSTSKDADYLAYSFRSYKILWKLSGSTATVTYTINYYLSAEQEKEVDKSVKTILKKLNINKASDYKKVKAIHDYIINLAQYDQTYSKYTAYDIFMNKTAVCQGYTLAAYRLFTEAGIQSKIITGRASGVSHSWNIVKVKGKWYNIDLTWDDPIASNREPILNYDYFLKNDMDFINHVRDAEYSTVEFLNKYMIAKKSY